MNQQIELFKLIIKNLEYRKIQSGPAGIFIYALSKILLKRSQFFISLHQITPGSNIFQPQYKLNRPQPKSKTTQDLFYMKTSLHVKKKTRLWVISVPDVSGSYNNELVCPLEGKEVEN